MLKDMTLPIKVRKKTMKNIEVAQLYIEYLCRTDDEFMEKVECVFEYFQDDRNKALLWFIVPNPLLGEVAPLEFITYLSDSPQGLKKFYRFLDDLKNANY